MGSVNHEASRRTILKSTALGAGALLGAAGLAGTATAATPDAAKRDAMTPDPAGTPGATTLSLNFAKTILALDSFSFGASRGASVGRSTAKEPTEGSVRFTAPSSKETPSLMLLAISGKSTKTASITGTDTATGAQYMKIVFTDVLISSLEIGGATDERPEDVGTLSYGKVQFSYYPFDAASGQLGTPAVLKWDVRTEKWSG